MKIRKFISVAIAACLVAGSIAGCGGKKAEDKVIKIGVFEPTTGENGGGGLSGGLRHPLRQPDTPYRDHRRRGIQGGACGG